MSNPKTSEKSTYLDREEHVTRGALSAKRVVNYTYDAGTDTLLPVTSSSSTYKLLLDDTTTTNVTYVGKAAIGSATSSAVWQIQKIDETSGMSITWGGTGAFDQEWDERAGTVVYA